MTFNFLNFLVVQQLAQRSRVRDGRDTEIALLSSLVPGAMGLLVGVIAIRNAEEPEPPERRDSQPRVATPSNDRPVEPHALVPART